MGQFRGPATEVRTNTFHDTLCVLLAAQVSVSAQPIEMHTLYRAGGAGATLQKYERAHHPQARTTYLRDMLPRVSCLQRK